MWFGSGRVVIISLKQYISLQSLSQYISACCTMCIKFEFLSMRGHGHYITDSFNVVLPEPRKNKTCGRQIFVFLDVNPKIDINI